MLRLPKTKIARLGTGMQCIFRKSIDYALPRQGYHFRSVFAFICPILYPWLCSVPLSTTREIGLYPRVPLQRPPSIVLLWLSHRKSNHMTYFTDLYQAEANV
jgi:hypothetical protein